MQNQLSFYNLTKAASYLSTKIMFPFNIKLSEESNYTCIHVCTKQCVYIILHVIYINLWMSVLAAIIKT